MVELMKAVELVQEYWRPEFWLILMLILLVVLARQVVASRDARIEARLHEITRKKKPSTHFQMASSSVETQQNEGFFGRLTTKLARIADNLPSLGKKDEASIGQLLVYANLRHRHAVPAFVTLKYGMALTFAFATYTAVISQGFFEDKAMIQMGIGICGGIVGMLIPEMILRQLAARRQKKLRRSLPDALDLMVICTEAGQSLDVAVDRVAREIGFAAKELGEEFGIAAAEMKILPDRRDALDNLCYRTGIQEVRGLVATLAQSQRYGTSLAHSLRVLADEMRKTRMLAIEEKAARLPAMMSVPLITFILPSIFVVIAGPAAIDVMELMK